MLSKHSSIMFKLLCSITLLHFLSVQCQTNTSDLTTNKDLETSFDVVNPSVITSNVSTSDNLSDLETTSDVVNQSLTSNSSIIGDDLETTSDLVNTSLTSNFSNSGNVSDVQFAVEPRALRLDIRVSEKRRRRGRYGDSGLDEFDPLYKDYGSEEDYLEDYYEYPSEEDCELPPPPPPKPSIKYVISNTKVDWHSARDQCRSRGMKLATILSKEEQKNIEVAIKNRELKWNDHFWIGSMDSYNGEFRWLEPPTPFYYTNWDVNEPNRGVLTPGHLNDEHCLELKNFHKWNDLNCDAEEFYICQTR